MFFFFSLVSFREALGDFAYYCCLLILHLASRPTSGSNLILELKISIDIVLHFVIKHYWMAVERLALYLAIFEQASSPFPKSSV